MLLKGRCRGAGLVPGRNVRPENWVLGTMQAAGKRALFLRTYSPHVSLFLTDDLAFECVLRTQLTVAGIKLVRNPLRMDQRNDRIVVLCEGGESHLLDIVYPVLGCNVRSQLATNLGAKCTELGTLEVDAHQQTTVERIYAVGDVVTDLHQLTVATGHAAVAATNIHNRLPANFPLLNHTLGVGGLQDSYRPTQKPWNFRAQVDGASA